MFISYLLPQRQLRDAPRQGLRGYTLDRFCINTS